MKRLYRYIAREITVPFFLSIFVFTFVLLLDRIMKLVEMVIGKGVGLADIGRLFIYILPSFLTLTIPMSFLMAVLLAFGRFSSDSEIVAMKASGVSLYQMLIPVSILSILAYGMTFYLTLYALPWGNQSFRAKVFDIARAKASAGVKERVFNDDFDGIVLYIDRLKGEEMEGVLIYDRREKDGYTIFARGGGIVSDPKEMTVTMRLREGEIHKAGKELSYSRVAFSTYELRLNFSGSSPGSRGDVSKGDREMTISELSRKVAELKGRGENFKPYQVEIHKKFSIPFACIIFGLIGAPLGIKSRRSGRGFGFSMSLAIFLIYYISLTAGESLGDRGIIPPFLAMWGINFLFLAIGIYFIVKTDRESPIVGSVRLDQAVDLLTRFVNKFGRAQMKG